MLFVERNGKLWGEVENICLCEHLFVFFLNFSFSVQGEKMFLFFFLLGAMHFSSPPHHIKILPKSPKILPKSPKSQQQKNQQNLTKYNSPLPLPTLHLSSLPTSQKNIKIKIKKTTTTQNISTQNITSKLKTKQKS